MGVLQKVKPRGLLAILIYFWFMARIVFNGILLNHSMPDVTQAIGSIKLVWILTWLVFAASAVVSLVAFCKLKDDHQPASARFAVMALWITGPLTQLMYGMVAIAVTSTQAAADSMAMNGLIGFTVGKTIPSILFAGAWMAYLKYSKQVRILYYGKDMTPQAVPADSTIVPSTAARTEWDEMV